MNKKRILVVIVAFNSMKWAERCYNSLRQSHYSCDIVTIDNGSTDGTKDFLKINYPEVELVEMERNIGFGAANNIGLKKALEGKYEYVYLLNQDAWVFPDTFEKLIDAHQQNLEFGVLSPMQIQADTQCLDYKFATNVIGIHQRKQPLLIDDLFFDRKKQIYEVSFVMAAHWLISIDCIRKVGGFSPSFFLYGEDDNYIDRVFLWQKKVGIVPEALAVHDRGNIRWSEEKNKFISHYILPLVKCSNPQKALGVWSFIKDNVKCYIVSFDTSYIKYAFNLFRYRHIIYKNRTISEQECAFL